MSLPHNFFSRLVFMLSLLLGFTCALKGQFETSEIKISTEKVVINGKFFILHTVKENHTFFSICKAYQISEKEVLLVNPGLIPSRLSVGQVIKIPFVREISEIAIPETNDFIYHQVEKGQTLYSIQLKYGTSVEIIKQYNPTIIGNSISIGQVLKIPKQAVDQKGESEFSYSDSLFIKYLVKPEDRLYKISNKFRIPIAEIISINKSLRDGLKPGTILYLPKDVLQYADVSAIIDSTVDISSQFLSFEKCDSIHLNSSISEIRIAVFLPFGKIEQVEIDSMLADELQYETSLIGTTKESIRYSAMVAEYYEGLLLALDSIKKQNIDISLFTYNTMGDTSQLKKKIGEVDALDPDIIIGPLRKDNIRLVANFAKKNAILHILPFSRNTDHLKDHPTCFQLLPPEDIIHDHSLRYLASLKNTNLYFIHKNDSFELAKAEKYDSLIQAYRNANATDTLKVFKIAFSDSTYSYLYDTISVERNNVMIPLFYRTNDDDQADLIHIYSIFKELNLRYNFSVFGHYAWQTYKNLRIEPYHDFKTHFISPFYIDYNHQLTNYFIAKSKAVLGYEPWRKINTGLGFNFAYLGFETGLMFGEAFAKYGKQLTLCNQFLYNSLIQSNYRFIQAQNGLGFYNTSFTLLHFDNDYLIKILKKE